MYASAAMVAPNRGLGELRAHQKGRGLIGFARSINRNGPIVGFGRGLLATVNSTGRCNTMTASGGRSVGIDRLNPQPKQPFEPCLSMSAVQQRLLLVATVEQPTLFTKAVFGLGDSFAFLIKSQACERISCFSEWHHLIPCPSSEPLCKFWGQVGKKTTPFDQALV